MRLNDDAAAADDDGMGGFALELLLSLEALVPEELPADLLEATLATDGGTTVLK